jgi:hypothetical protein
MPVCTIQGQTIPPGVRTLRIENDLLSATILLDKGADIYELIYKPIGIDVLWKSPWGLRQTGRGVPTAFQSEAAWLEYYAGGWQGIFPNGGPACIYKGVELNFHGEASVVPWNYETVRTEEDDFAEVLLSARLFRSPFRIERRMRVEAGLPQLIIQERITNEGGEPMDYMWGHHPAYGSPFLSEACRIDTGATAFRADDTYPGTANPLTPGASYTWPIAAKDGAEVDMSQVPGPAEPRDILAYFEEFESGWYGITNTHLGVGVGLVWPREVFPYAWFWQEMYGSVGFPWYKSVYVMAIEPFTTFPGQGLVTAMEKTGSHCTLDPGKSVEVELRAVFYESKTGIKRIEADGTVII